MHQEDSLLLLGLGLIFLGLNSSNSLQNSLMSITKWLNKKERRKERKQDTLLSSVVCKKQKQRSKLACNEPTCWSATLLLKLPGSGTAKQEKSNSQTAYSKSSFTIILWMTRRFWIHIYPLGRDKTPTS